MKMSDSEISSEHLPVRGGLTLIYASSPIIALIMAAVSLAGLFSRSGIYPIKRALETIFQW